MTITDEFLRERLQLPDDVKIINVVLDPLRVGCLNVILEGPDFPEVDLCDSLRRVTPTYIVETRTFDKTKFDKWR